jgi:HlyD family secretion protein
LKRWIPIVVVVIVVGGLVTLSLMRRDRSVRVDTALVEARALTATVRASGTIQPTRQVNVSANTMGTITHLAVEEGQHVQAGDLLLQIDPTEYRAVVHALEASVRTGEADLRLAEASLEKAQADHRRVRELFEQGLASEENLISVETGSRVEAARVESARHRLSQVEANLEKAQHDLQKVTITTPMTGLITRLNVEEGENAIMGTLNNPGTVLLTIADLDTMEAWVQVDETEVVGVRLGQAAGIEIDAYPDTTFAGVVTEIGHSPLSTYTGAGQQAVDFEIKITLRDRVEAIRPGLTAKAEITVADRQDAVAVPLEAVTMREWPLKDEDIRLYSGSRAKKQRAALGELGFTTDGAPADTTTSPTEGVFLVRERFVKFQPVKIGIAGEEHFEVTSGLEPGTVVVSGPFRVLRELKDGAMITIQSDEKKRGQKDRKKDAS